MEKIDRAVLDAAMTYAQYRFVTDNLLAQNKTTGQNHSEAMLHYTRMNVTRMARLDKTTELTSEALEKLAQIQQPLTWLVVTEAWCGDAAQIVPVLDKLAEAHGNIDLRFILRDEHSEIMDAFLTNGSRSIPKVIILDTNTLEVLGSWGPRPSALQAILLPMIDEMKATKDKHTRKAKYEALKIEAQRWYNQDKTKSIQREMVETTLAAASVKMQ